MEKEFDHVRYSVHHLRMAKHLKRFLILNAIIRINSTKPRSVRQRMESARANGSPVHGARYKYLLSHQNLSNYYDFNCLIFFKCSKPCGGGDATRKVICLKDSMVVPTNNCGVDIIMFSSESCNQFTCGPGEYPFDSWLIVNFYSTKTYTCILSQTRSSRWSLERMNTSQRKM